MITVVKIGGTILESVEKTALFLNAFVALPHPKILVHGGGKDATRLADKLAVESTFEDGRRITSKEMLEVLTCSYAGKNKQLVAALQAQGTGALGLCGADGAILPSHKRDPNPVDFGWVGDPIQEQVNMALVDFCLSKNMVPVFSALTWEAGSASLLNTNADTIALTLATSAVTYGQVRLLYAFEFSGVLKTISDETTRIPELSKTDLSGWIADGTIHSGMLPKLECGFKAVENGVKEVEIVRYDTLSNGTKLIA